jgi:hypothetical protein
VLPFGSSILTLYQYLRLYDAVTGELQAEWPDLDTGQTEA